MKSTPPRSSDEARDREIATLRATLQATEQRLRELTANARVEAASAPDAGPKLRPAGKPLTQAKGEKSRPVQDDLPARNLAETVRELAASTALLRLFIQHTPAAIAMLDTQMHYIQTSERWMQDYRLDGQTIIGKSHYEIFPDAPPRWKAIHERVLAGQVERCEEDPFPRADGTIEWLQWEARPWFKAEREIGGIVLFTQIITRRKEAERAMRESHEKFQQLVDHITDAFWIRSPDFGEVHYVSPAFERIWGRSVASLYASPRQWVNFIFPEDREKVVTSFKGLTADEPNLEIEYRIVRPSGEIRWVRVRGFQVRDAENHLIRHIGIVTDITARRQVAIELEKSLEEFRTLAESMPQIVWITQSDGWNIYFNQQWMDYTGLTLEESLGQGWKKAFHPEDQQRAGDAWQQAAEVHGIYSIECRLRRADGAYRRWLVRGVPQLDAAGKILKWFGTCTDVNDLKLAEESLGLLSSAIEQAGDSIVITNAELNVPGPTILFVNPAYTKMTGYTAQEAIGKNPRMLHGPRTDRSVLKRLRESLERGEVFQGQVINYRKDGTEFDMEWQITPLRDAAGKIGHFVAIQRDITQRKLAEQALRASEQRFKAFFEQAAVGVALADATTGRFFQVNQRLCEIVGRGRDELEQLTFAGISHPQDIEHDVELAQQIQRGPLREYKHERRFLRKDGTEVWVDLTVSAMWGPGATPDYFIAVAQDITERKKLEEQVRQAQKLEAIGTLAGGIAHDFNNILTAISGYTELSQMRLQENPDVRSYLDAVAKATSRATRLVQQILTFSRRQPLERHPLQLLPVVSEALQLLRATIPSTIEFQTSLPTNAPVVLADAGQIHQLLMNLGTNAWHAMKDRTGRLRITLERWVVDATQAARESQLRPGIYARIAVSDTGSGMDPATLKRIFEPFFTTKPSGEGTGLGLAVVHGIMDGHDGAVTVRSEVGAGTDFHLYFPAYAGDASTAVIEGGTIASGHGERILFVDDEEMLVQFGQRVLAAMGYEVEVTTKPDVALALVRADPRRFALVMTDYTMPHMTGLMLAAELRQIRPGLPVILMTGYGQALTTEGVGAAGIGELLHKPFTMAALGGAVHAALHPRPSTRSPYSSRAPY